MMLFVGWSSPAGVVLFWVTSSAWAVVQQQLILGKRNREYEKKEEAEEVVKPVEVDVVRRTKKPRPTKKH
jgi:YidC/Oxa1 family membrane protein insertase